MFYHVDHFIVIASFAIYKCVCVCTHVCVQLGFCVHGFHICEFNIDQNVAMMAASA